MPRFKTGPTVRDYLAFTRDDLGQRKLRTALTVLGVAVGIGALTAMVGFGLGMQRIISQSFAKMDIFDSLTVLPDAAASPFAGREGASGPDPDAGSGPISAAAGKGRSGPPPVLDDAAVARIAALPGVASAVPENRFPAMIRIGGAEEFRIVQVVPAGRKPGAPSVSAGRVFESEEEESAILAPGLLRQMGFAEPAAALGRRIEISSLSLDLGGFSPFEAGGLMSGKKMPFKKETYAFTVVGVAEGGGFGGPLPLASDILIPPGPASRMVKLPFTNIWDLFRAGEGRAGYPAVNVRLSAPGAAASVQREIRAMGFGTFSLLDQFEQVKAGFVVMDMLLAAVGMIALFVAALGIINTMVMAVLERTREIGIMKAVGAGRKGIRTVFLFESGAIGGLGGLSGLLLGWTASRVINVILNTLGGRQGLPRLEYFRFPLWLLICAAGFAVAVSVLAGLYPAGRAARVEPAVALRNE